MTYIVEKKIGQCPRFYEDAWQPCWDEMKRKYLEFGELPPGYEALCITQKQTMAAAAIICVFGQDDEEVTRLKSDWPHLYWDGVYEIARQWRPYRGE